jgi:phasin family protein
LFQAEDIMQFLSDNPALRTQLQTQVDFMNEFSQKSYDTLRQLSEMNLKLARQAIEGSMFASREMLSCTDPMQLVQAAMKQVQPATERVRAYQQHLLSVLAGAQAGLSHAAQPQVAETARSASTIADEILRNASVGANVPVTAPGVADIVSSAGPSSSSGNGSAQQPHHP